jgi:monofunctional biosynthetic peptidoglycan transglycosylase
MATLLLASLISLDADHFAGDLRLFDFGSEGSVESWYAINDGVMGGVSAGGLSRSSDNAASFAGRVSLENNGGFASVRSTPGKLDLGRFDGLRLRIRGDGHRFKINLKTDRTFDGLMYRAVFETRAGRWETVEIPFSAFEPTYRGRIVSDAPVLDSSNVTSLGLMISDKQAGPFVLELQWIDAFRRSS